MTAGRWARNVLAVVGALAVVTVVAWLLIDFVARKGLCQQTLGNTASVSDTKASVYQFDCGAMGATRTYVMLSNPSVDGWKSGDSVLVLLGQFSPLAVQLRWETNRRLKIAFPTKADVEFAVAKTRGITIELEPTVGAAPNEARR